MTKITDHGVDEERLKQIEEELEHHMMGSYLTQVVKEELLPYIRELEARIKRILPTENEWPID